MGTKAVTTFIENAQVLCKFYVQFDGYIENGYGEQLIAALNGMQLVNGLYNHNYKVVFNGIGDLAARVISWFTTDRPGGEYIISPLSIEPPEWEYRIFNNVHTQKMGETQELYPIMLEILYYGEKKYFGKVDDFDIKIVFPDEE